MLPHREKFPLKSQSAIALALFAIASHNDDLQGDEKEKGSLVQLCCSSHEMR